MSPEIGESQKIVEMYNFFRSIIRVRRDMWEWCWENWELIFYLEIFDIYLWSWKSDKFIGKVFWESRKDLTQAAGACRGVKIDVSILMWPRPPLTCLVILMQSGRRSLYFFWRSVLTSNMNWSMQSPLFPESWKSWKLESPIFPGSWKCRKLKSPLFPESLKSWKNKSKLILCMARTCRAQKHTLRVISKEDTDIDI